jgi:hypothetical protein
MAGYWSNLLTYNFIQGGFKMAKKKAKKKAAKAKAKKKK